MTLIGATPALPVSDLAASSAFYVDRLGFRRLHGDDDRVVVVRDTVAVALSRAEPGVDGTGSTRVRVHDLDAVFDEFRAGGALAADEVVVDQPWGRSEFTVFDPDRNCLTFFAPSEERSRH